MRYGRSAMTAVILVLATAGVAAAWGFDGHRMVARGAVDGLPADVPAFFTAAADQLVYLNPEPDRWRDDTLTVMDEAWKYDHYIDLENVPPSALDAPDRFAFLQALYAAGVGAPHQSVGFLPYRIMELYQRLASGFARWRLSEPDERAWVEARIINDAGILGHYVADAANPHHTTIHFNGWAAGAPNPEGYTTSRDFHWQFESRFVGSRVSFEDVRGAVLPGVDTVSDLRTSVWEYLMTTHAEVVPLYALEKAVGFDPEHPTPRAEAFAIERLAAGARMLRSLWYAAWLESAAIAAREN